MSSVTKLEDIDGPALRDMLNVQRDYDIQEKGESPIADMAQMNDKEIQGVFVKHLRNVFNTQRESDLEALGESPVPDVNQMTDEQVYMLLTSIDDRQDERERQKGEERRKNNPTANG